MRVIFSKLAKQELDDASRYLEIEFQRLGKRFREEVRKAAKRITNYPEAWSVERGDVWKCLLHDSLDASRLPMDGGVLTDEITVGWNKRSGSTESSLVEPLRLFHPTSCVPKIRMRPNHIFIIAVAHQHRKPDYWVESMNT